MINQQNYPEYYVEQKQESLGTDCFVIWIKFHHHHLEYKSMD